MIDGTPVIDIKPYTVRESRINIKIGWLEEKLIEKAIEIDREAWKDFTLIEAKRIMERLSLPENGGLSALKTALKFRLYAYINKSVGIVEYTYFAREIDGRIETECIYCPPDPHPSDSFCAWRFLIRE